MKIDRLAIAVFAVVLAAIVVSMQLTTIRRLEAENRRLERVIQKCDPAARHCGITAVCG